LRAKILAGDGADVGPIAVAEKPLCQVEARRIPDPFKPLSNLRAFAFIRGQVFVLVDR
jgi:hypothetical protein